MIHSCSWRLKLQSSEIPSPSPGPILFLSPPLPLYSFRSARCFSPDWTDLDFEKERNRGKTHLLCLYSSLCHLSRCSVSRWSVLVGGPCAMSPNPRPPSVIVISSSVKIASRLLRYAAHSHCTARNRLSSSRHVSIICSSLGSLSVAFICTTISP